MSLQTVAALTNDSDFGGRVIACTTQQAEVFKDDARADFVALANAALRGEVDKQAAMWRTVAAGPGIADSAGTPPDQLAIADEDILASVQANWQVIAGCYYDAEGVPL